MGKPRESHLLRTPNRRASDHWHGAPRKMASIATRASAKLRAYADMLSTLGVAAAMTLASTPSGHAAEAVTRTYIAKYVSQVPVVDGMLTSPDEWNAASGIGSGWNSLGGQPDASDNRFTMVWNDAGLFLQHQVNGDRWQARGTSSIDWNYENLNFYFDPNRDGESNANNKPKDSGIDGYQIAFNQPLGASEISEQTKTAGAYIEAHVNSLFGDGGGTYSQFAHMVVMQTTSVEDHTAYTEVFIPWSDFDATDPDDGFDPKFDDIGLFHPFAPADGEEWFFNMGRIQTDGRLIAWSSEPGANGFASRPHGVLRFSQPTDLPGDFNGDGNCDDLDIDMLSAAVRNNSQETRYDVNSDQRVDNDDRVYFIEVLKKTYFGDSNFDLEFSTSDFVKVFQEGEYEDAVAMNSGWADGDWNGDGDFSTADFVTAFQTSGFEMGPRAAVSAVPEPASFAMALLSGLGALQSRRLRRRV